MASATPRASPPSGSGHCSRNESRERQDKIPEIQSSTILPRLPVHVQDAQTLLKRRVKRKEPSLQFLKMRERLYFPGWAPSKKQTELPHRRREQLPVHLPVHLPPLKTTGPLMTHPMASANPWASPPSGFGHSSQTKQTEQPHRRREQLPVHLPPLKSTGPLRTHPMASATPWASPPSGSGHSSRTKQTEQPHRRREQLPVHLPVHLPPLKSTGPLRTHPMASATPWASPPSGSGHSSRTKQTEQPHRRREQLPVHLPPLKSTGPLRTHPMASPPSGFGHSSRTKQTEQPHRRREQLPVHLPPLKSTGKMLVLKQSLPRRPFSIKSSGLLDTDSNVMLKYSEDDYLLISSEGVLSVCQDDHDFMTLECWEQEYNDYCKLLCIPFFARFRIWKPFYVWRAKIRAKKVHLAKVAIQNDLLIVNQSLGSALIDIKKMCFQISDTSLCHIEKKHTYTLQEFSDNQFRQLQEVLSDLENFQDLVKEVTVSACHNYLAERHFCDETTCKDLEEFVKEMNKNFLSTRLIRFIRLVDYLVADTLRMLVVNAAAKLMAVFQEQVCQMPSQAIIQSWSQSEATIDPAEKEMDKKSTKSKTPCVQPMFISELILDTNALTFKPSEENFQETVAEIIGWFKKTVMSVKALTADPDFDSVTQLHAFTKLKVKYDSGPCLESIIENDGHLQSIIQNIKESLRCTFDAAKLYSQTFEHFRLFYKENESLDLDAMRQQDHGLSFFEKALELYHSEHKEALAIQPKRHLGLLLVDKTQLKEKVVSSPHRCLEAINEMLPQLAKRKLDAAMAQSLNIQVQLDFKPSTIAELEELEERITVLEEEQKTLCQMYNLINMYSIPTPPEDPLYFARLEPLLDSLYLTIYVMTFKLTSPAIFKKNHY